VIALDEVYVFNLLHHDLLTKYLLAFKIVCIQAKAFANLIGGGFALWAWVSEIEGGEGNDLVLGLNQVGSLLFEQVLAAKFEVPGVVGGHVKTRVRRNQIFIPARQEAF